MVVLGECFGCKQVFTFSAERVPSVLVRGEREPICRDCVARVNPTRRQAGLPEIEILPGAYEADEVD